MFDICVYLSLSIYIYIHIGVCVYIYIYIYTHTLTHVSLAERQEARGVRDAFLSIDLNKEAGPAGKYDDTTSTATTTTTNDDNNDNTTTTTTNHNNNDDNNDNDDNNNEFNNRHNDIHITVRAGRAVLAGRSEVFAVGLVYHRWNRNPRPQHGV